MRQNTGLQGIRGFASWRVRSSTRAGIGLWSSSVSMWRCSSALLLAALPLIGMAQEAAPERTAPAVDESPGLVVRATDYVDEAQRQASVRFTRFMTQVDGFFSDATISEDALDNDSWARIRLDARRPAGESFELKPSVKLRASLPNTERRFKLLLSTEDDDTDVVGGDVERLQSASGDSGTNASAAIRFIRSARDDGSADIDIGVRQRDGEIQYFGRLVLGYRTVLDHKWRFNASNSYWHYNKSGFENRFMFSFQRPLFYQENLYFRSHTQFNWRKGNKGATVGQTIGLYSQFGERKALALEGLAGYHTALNDEIEDRYRGHELRARWRHNVWREWFFYEIWPSISWPASRDHERSWGILLRMEMLVGNH